MDLWPALAAGAGPQQAVWATPAAPAWTALLQHAPQSWAQRAAYASTQEADKDMKPANGSWRWMVDQGHKVNPCNSR